LPLHCLERVMATSSNQQGPKHKASAPPRTGNVWCIILCSVIIIVFGYFMVIDFGFHASYNHLYSETELRSYLLPLPHAHYNDSNLELKFTKQRYKRNRLLTQFESFPEYDLNQTLIYNKFIRHKQGHGIVYSVGTTLGLVQTFVSISIILSQVIGATPNEVGIEIVAENEKLLEQCNGLFEDILADPHLDVVCVLMDRPMIDFVDANFYSSEQSDDRRLWSAKYIALIQSRFEHVLFMDCDNIVIRDPRELFRSPFYRRYQAVFWPDLTYGPNNWCDFRFYVEGPEHNAIWDIYNLSRRYDAEDIRYFYSQESGQILMNTKLYHNELLFALSNNDRNATRSAIYGDKDFWRITFLTFNTSFLMVPYLPLNIGSLSTVFRGKSHMGQFWFDHKLLFLHGTKHLNCYSFIQFAYDKTADKVESKYLCKERYKKDIAWIPTKLLRDITSYLSGYRLTFLGDSHFYFDDESIAIDLDHFQESWRRYYISACSKMAEWGDGEEMEALCQCQDPFPVHSRGQWITILLVFMAGVYMLHRMRRACSVKKEGGAYIRSKVFIVISLYRPLWGWVGGHRDGALRLLPRTSPLQIELVEGDKKFF